MKGSVQVISIMNFFKGGERGLCSHSKKQQQTKQKNPSSQLGLNWTAKQHTYTDTHRHTHRDSVRQMEQTLDCLRSKECYSDPLRQRDRGRGESVRLSAGFGGDE